MLLLITVFFAEYQRALYEAAQIYDPLATNQSDRFYNASSAKNYSINALIDNFEVTNKTPRIYNQPKYDHVYNAASTKKYEDNAGKHNFEEEHRTPKIYSQPKQSVNTYGTSSSIKQTHKAKNTSNVLPNQTNYPKPKLQL